MNNRSIDDSQVRSVYMTFPDEESAVRVSSALLQENLIACANLLPGARSLYRWEGEVQDDREVVAFAKTTRERLASLTKRVEELHPYDVPCVVALRVDGGDRRYLEWVAEETVG